MMKRRILMSAGLLVWSVTAASQAQKAPPAAPATIAPLRDDALEKSLRAGAGYLLEQIKNNNMETERPGEKPTRMEDMPPGKGMESALALYALLLAGQNVDDPRLKPGSTELAPVVTWLTKLEPDTTAAAAMQISALSMIPKGKESREIDAAIFRARDFLAQTCGLDGGHGVGRARSIDNRSFIDAFTAYVDARYPTQQAPNQQQILSEAKTRLDDVVRQSHLLVGGPQAEFLSMQKSIKDRDLKPGAAQKRAVQELTELQTYLEDAASMTSPPYTDQELAVLRRAKADLEKAKPLPGEAGIRQGEQLEIATRLVAKAEFEIKARARPQGNTIDSALANMAFTTLATAGVEIRPNTFPLDEKFWHIAQKTDGTWGFYPDGALLNKSQTGAATTGALGSLIAIDVTTDADPRLDKSIDKGLAWLDADFPTSSKGPLYVYGIERVAMGLGKRTFGGVPWFETCARDLVKSQEQNGAWRGTFTYETPVTATAWAVAFLAKGRLPLVFNKLEYKGGWNSHSHDGMNLAQWMNTTTRTRDKIDRGFAWQNVKIDDAPDAWNEAPILMIAGAHDPKFTADELKKLRAFVDAGGMIVSTSDGNNPEFTNAIRAAASKMVDGQYEMKSVDEKSPLFSAWAPMKKQMQAFALSNGVRTLWVQSDADWGASWQRRGGTGDSFDVFGNLYFYATSMQNHCRLDPRAIDTTRNSITRTVNVARVRFAGNWDPEPGAWKHFVQLAKGDFHTAIELKEVDLAALDPKTTPVAHLWGTGKVTFSDDAARTVKNYIGAGGVLIVEAAGGDQDFAASARALIKKALPGLSLDSLRISDSDHEKEDPIYKGTMKDAKPVETVAYRPYWTKVINAGKENVIPSLQGIKAPGNGRPLVIFSDIDISSGLLGTDTWGIAGYSPASSYGLMRNILLNAIGK